MFSFSDFMLIYFLIVTVDQSILLFSGFSYLLKKVTVYFNFKNWHFFNVLKLDVMYSVPTVSIVAICMCFQKVL